MNPLQNRFVACIDVLGFKRLRAEKGTAALFEHYVRGPIRAASDAIYPLKDGMNPRANLKIFSDTFLLWSHDENLTGFTNLLFSVYQLIRDGFLCNMPLRGAIGYGDLIASDHDPAVLIGSAIEDAYISESKQVWSGCILTDACRRVVEQRKYIQSFKKDFLEVAAQTSELTRATRLRRLANVLIEYDVPTQTTGWFGRSYKSERHLVLDWTLETNDGVAKKAFLTPESKHAHRIVRNTVGFEEEARRSLRRSE